MKRLLSLTRSKHINRVERNVTHYLRKGSVYSYTLTLVWLLSLKDIRSDLLRLSERIVYT